MGLNWIHNLSLALGGEKERPLTLTFVLEELRQQPQPTDLPARLVRLSEKMDQAAQESLADLQSGSFCRDFARLLQKQVDGYRDLAERLERLGQQPTVALEIEALARAGQAQTQLARQLADDFRRGAPRCTGCGAECGDYCADCQMAPLVWDALPEEYETVDCPGGVTFQTLERQLLALLEGRASLDEVEVALNDFTSELEPILAETSPARLERGLDGLYAGLESRRTSDLLNGWQDLCRGMLGLQEELSALA